MVRVRFGVWALFAVIVGMAAIEESASAQPLAGVSEGNNFVGVMGGVATLSADATTSGSPPQSTAGYKPENGATVMAYLGRHFYDYFSMQASYSWNRNGVLLNGGDFTRGSSFAAPMQATMHTVGLEGMAYFRDRSSKLRPYLSAGPMVTRLIAEKTGAATTMGGAALPPSRFTGTKLGLRVAVGIDWAIARRVSLRYTFSETIQRNPLGEALTPRGERRLANFQNLWGVQVHF